MKYLDNILIYRPFGDLISNCGKLKTIFLKN